MMRRLRQSKRQTGFSLIELMVSISIMAIITAIGVPSFNTMLANNQATTAANRVLLGLQLARSEAVKLSQPVRIEALGEQWNQGWQIRQGDTLIRQESMNSTDLTIDCRGNCAPLSFSPVGTLTANATFQVAVSGGSNPLRCITISISGKSQVQGGAC